MTWFQLVDAQRDDFEPRQPKRLVPNSALFLNPALALEGKARPEAPARVPHTPVRGDGHLRLVKGARVGLAGVPSAA